MTQPARRLAVAVVALSLAATGPAAAHQPVVLTAADVSAASGPLLPDGTISWAVYGSVGKRRPQGFKVRFTKADPVLVELLVPANGAERTRIAASSLRARVTSPSGAVTVLTPTGVTAFTETFTQTSYLRLARFESVAAESGTYSVTVDASLPTRWCLAVGTIERFDRRATDEDRPTELADVQRWYRTKT